MVVMYVIHTSSFLHKNHHMSSGVAQDIWPCGTKELTTELSLEGDNSLINENQDTLTMRRSTDTQKKVSSKMQQRKCIESQFHGRTKNNRWKRCSLLKH